jgi:hypothetical protein
MTQTPASAQKSRVCKKLIVDSVPVAVCVRSAPTVIAVHRWGVCGAQQSMVFITQTQPLHIDSIYAYTTHVTLPRHVTTLRRSTIHHRSHPSVHRSPHRDIKFRNNPFCPTLHRPKIYSYTTFCIDKSIYLDMWLGQDFSRIFLIFLLSSFNYDLSILS